MSEDNICKISIQDDLFNTKPFTEIIDEMTDKINQALSDTYSYLKKNSGLFDTEEAQEKLLDSAREVFDVYMKNYKTLFECYLQYDLSEEISFGDNDGGESFAP